MNKRTDERVAHCLRLGSCLFQATVHLSCSSPYLSLFSLSLPSSILYSTAHPLCTRATFLLSSLFSYLLPLFLLHSLLFLPPPLPPSSPTPCSSSPPFLSFLPPTNRNNSGGFGRMRGILIRKKTQKKILSKDGIYRTLNPLWPVCWQISGQLLDVSEIIYVLAIIKTSV